MRVANRAERSAMQAQFEAFDREPTWVSDDDDTTQPSPKRSLTARAGGGLRASRGYATAFAAVDKDINDKFEVRKQHLQQLVISPAADEVWLVFHTCVLNWLQANSMCTASHGTVTYRPSAQYSIELVGC